MDLQVPKLRGRNKERSWEILERYQRSLGNLMDWLCCLSVMGLSLRDLQEALYFLLNRVLSVECRESNHSSSPTKTSRKTSIPNTIKAIPTKETTDLSRMVSAFR